MVTALATWAAPAAITLSAWVNPTSLPNAYNTIINHGTATGSVNYFTLDIKSNGKLAMGVLASAGVSYDGTGSHTITTATQWFLTLTYSSSAGLVGYVNGASDNTAAANGTINTASKPTWIGKNGSFNCCFFTGGIDEVRISSVARSANWITTEYNNQSAPGTFATLGTEIGPTSTANFFTLFP